MTSDMLRRLWLWPFVCVFGWAIASDWAPVPAQSAMRFVVRVDGQTVAGQIAQIYGVLTWPDRHDRPSHIRLCVPSASLSVGSADGDRLLHGSNFMAVDRWPWITFDSHLIVHKQEQFWATGQLHIRGVTRDVTIPFVFVPKTRRLTAQFSVSRTAFGVGEGKVEGISHIDDKVTLSFELAMTEGDTSAECAVASK